ncbi:VirB4 family type IV secretion/conjugal transfer ATPase [Muricoccus pecuniae]|uniref:Type IV secretion system protein VirB4 n=1 Tax=Muricoccus pecuniae TaxID=693023 RepID=A0A840Y4K7_9PROT|nr:hypothetical protein [Roseomonas pecuniae]MBB5696058.1 type IV secretion system protein VirB4 [Roseomonas pecuniae]
MFDNGRFTLTDKPADEYLPILGHVADNVVELEDGTLMMVLRLDGRPLTLLTEEARYAARRERHSALRALYDTNVTILEHHVCHDRVDAFAPGPFRSAYGRDLLQAYHAALDRDLLAREWFVTILVHPRPISGAMAKLSRIFGKAAEVDAALLRQVRDRAAVIRRSLRAYTPRILGRRWADGAPFSEIGEAVRLILYGRWSPVPEMRGALASAIYTDRVVCGLAGIEVRAPGRNGYAVIMGLRDYPEIARPWILDGLLAVRRRIVMTNRFAFQSAAAATGRMARTQRQMANARDRAHSVSEGLDEAMDAVESGRSVMGDHHWSLTVHADTQEELSEALGEVSGILTERSNVSAIPEALGCFPAYWAQVPGAPGATLARHGGVHGFNFLSFSSCAGFPKGAERPWWGAPLLRLVTEGHTAHDFDPHVRRVGHTLMLGPTGYGKSTFLGLVAVALEQVLAPKGGVCVILDKDASNELTIRACGGYYARVRRGVGSGMAPLRALQDTDEARSWLEGFVLGLILLDGRGEPPPHMTDRLRTAIAFLMRRPPEMRSLGGLRQFLDHGAESTGGRLERWCRGGALGWAFDGEEDLIRLDAGIVGIDNTELLSDDMATIRIPAAAYQFFRIRERVGRGVRGAVLVDEAASYLPNDGSGFAEGFDAFSRELRKGNGLLWLAAHKPEDMARTEAGRTLLTNTPTKILFPNPEANEAAYRDLLHCSEGEMEQITGRMRSLGEGTFLVKRPEGSFVARAPLDTLPEHIAVLSNDPLRSALWERIGREIGTTDPAAIWPVYRTRYMEASA